MTGCKVIRASASPLRCKQRNGQSVTTHRTGCRHVKVTDQRTDHIQIKNLMVEIFIGLVRSHLGLRPITLFPS